MSASATITTTAPSHWNSHPVRLNDTASVAALPAARAELRCVRSSCAVLRAIHADCASSNATVSAPLTATTTTSQPIERRPSRAISGTVKSIAARMRSAAIIVRRLGQRSTSAPSSSAASAPAATSATASSAIAVGSAFSTSTASQFIASRLISEPKVDTTSAAKTRRNDPVDMGGDATCPDGEMECCWTRDSRFCAMRRDTALARPCCGCPVRKVSRASTT